MNLVDSCGWLEYLAGGRNAAYFAKPIEDTARLIVPTVCIYEVFKRVMQQAGRSAALEVIAAMRQGKVMPLSENLALEAADLGSTLKLALADSIILATARAEEATVWTQDSHFKNLPGINYIATRPTP